MKNCPKCGELIGDNIVKCFNCFFDMSNPETNAIVEKERLKNERELLEKKQKEAEYNRIKTIKEKNERIFSINDLYEYDIETISDLQTGESNTSAIISTINMYAKNGWKLHTIYTNEIGKTSHPQAFGISTVNATIDQTILIFERKVSLSESKN